MPLRKIIQIDESKCTGCGLCVVDCAEGALAIIDGKAKVVRDSFCDGLGACIGACPEGALKIIEREADEFDESAVAQHLAKKDPPAVHKEPEKMACGCPGSMTRSFRPAAKASHSNNDTESAPSELGQWPVQLRLVPPFGQLWEDTDVMLIADCVAMSYPDLHKKLISGHSVIMTCPKLDDQQYAIEKLAAIFGNPVRSVGVAIMEVPCCGGLLHIAKQALALAGKEMEIDIVRIGVEGQVLESYRE